MSRNHEFTPRDFLEEPTQITRIPFQIIEEDFDGEDLFEFTPAEIAGAETPPNAEAESGGESPEPPDTKATAEIAEAGTPPPIEITAGRVAQLAAEPTAEIAGAKTPPNAEAESGEESLNPPDTEAVTEVGSGGAVESDTQDTQGDAGTPPSIKIAAGGVAQLAAEPTAEIAGAKTPPNAEAESGEESLKPPDTKATAEIAGAETPPPTTIEAGRVAQLAAEPTAEIAGAKTPPNAEAESGEESLNPPDTEAVTEVGSGGAVESDTQDTQGDAGTPPSIKIAAGGVAQLAAEPTAEIAGAKTPPNAEAESGEESLKPPDTKATAEIAGAETPPPTTIEAGRVAQLAAEPTAEIAGAKTPPNAEAESGEESLKPPDTKATAEGAKNPPTTEAGGGEEETTEIHKIFSLGSQKTEATKIVDRRLAAKATAEIAGVKNPPPITTDPHSPSLSGGRASRAEKTGSVPPPPRQPRTFFERVGGYAKKAVEYAKTVAIAMFTLFGLSSLVENQPEAPKSNSSDVANNEYENTSYEESLLMETPNRAREEGEQSPTEMYTFKWRDSLWKIAKGITKDEGGNPNDAIAVMKIIRELEQKNPKTASKPLAGESIDIASARELAREQVQKSKGIFPESLPESLLEIDNGTDSNNPPPTDIIGKASDSISTSGGEESSNTHTHPQANENGDTSNEETLPKTLTSSYLRSGETIWSRTEDMLRYCGIKPTMARRAVLTAIVLADSQKTEAEAMRIKSTTHRKFDKGKDKLDFHGAEKAVLEIKNGISPKVVAEKYGVKNVYKELSISKR